MFEANAKFIQQQYIIMYLLFIRIETLEWIDFFFVFLFLCISFNEQ